MQRQHRLIPLKQFLGRARLGAAFAFLFLPAPQATAQQVAAGRYWHLLLHYEKSMFGHARSLADGMDFFLSPRGKDDPEAELRADVAAFAAPESHALKVGPLHQHPQCAFPERYRYLKEALHLKIKDVSCPQYQEWISRFNPQGATLVFASAYLNNPASMFGHTFLRIDSKPRPGQTRENPLLDYGINYAAKTGNDGGITFAVLGLIGGYPGYFSLLPYFDKVNEYSNVESRDLWEYPLHLNNEQIHRMLAHVWELGTTYFDYFFFDENCSYHLLSLLEVARPDWHLTDAFFYWVIPGDTVRLLKTMPDALGEPAYRPSLQRRLQTRLYALSAAEKKQYRTDKENHFQLVGHEDAAVLDILIDQEQYNLMRAKKNADAQDKAEQRGLLLARAKVAPDVELELAVPPSSNRPDLGVRSRKLSVYGGDFLNAGHASAGYAGLQFRPVYHDLLDPDAGYQPFSELALARTNLRYYPAKNRFRVHEFQIAEVTSLAPSDELGNHLSWSANGGLFSPNDILCHQCTAFGLNGGAGESVWLAPESQSSLAFALLRVNLEYSGWFQDDFRFGPQLHLGAIDALSPRLKLYAAMDANYYPTQKSKFSLQPGLQAAWLFAPNYELRLASVWTRARRLRVLDSTAMLSLYF